jgi:ketosteroid isomerase-like protein
MIQNNQVTAELLENIVDAFNRRDIEAIVNSFAEDGVFLTARGPEPWGRKLIGRKAIGEYIAQRFESIPDMRWVEGRSFAAGDRGVSEWKVMGTSVDGEEINWLGCDIWEFKDGLVINKDTYWKYIDRKKVADEYL